MKKPNLYVIGAPKCGTTTLAYWMSQHPEVYVSPRKEPHYFFNPYRMGMSLWDYEALFEEVRPTQSVVAEASIWYLYSEVAVVRILNYNPDAKFVVCLRNPMEMAPSLHMQRYYSGYEMEPDFNLAWQLNSVREAGSLTKVYGIDPEMGDPSHMSYRKVCMLGRQVEQLLSRIDRDRVFFMFLDDMQSDPSALWHDLQIFLGVTQYGNIDMSAQNPATTHRNATISRFLNKLGSMKRFVGVKRNTGIFRNIHRWNTSKVESYHISDLTFESMYKCFEADVRNLFSLTNRKECWRPFGNNNANTWR
ncbi:MAG: sulfotransferase domain-containing protein [Pseudohongiellaceae bacterium]